MIKITLYLDSVGREIIIIIILNSFHTNPHANLKKKRFIGVYYKFIFVKWDKSCLFLRFMTFVGDV